LPLRTLRQPLIASLLTLVAAAPALAVPAAMHGPRRGPGHQTREARAASTGVTAPHLDYCGGKVLSQAKVIAILWGPPDPLPTGANASASCTGDFKSCLEAWYPAFIQSPEFNWLDEYQTTIPSVSGGAGTNQHIQAPIFLGVVQITPANTAAVVGESDVETELVSQIQAGNLPAPDADDETIYEVFFPLSVDPSDPNFQACLDFCAYHDSWQSNILGTNGILAIMPSGMPPGYQGGKRDCAQCGERSDWFANLGGSISHETTEAITDPFPGGSCAPPTAWLDTLNADGMSPHGEIGDICEGLEDTGVSAQITEVSFTDVDGGSSYTYTVQREWSNFYSSCLGTVDDAFTLEGPDGGVTGSPGGSTDIPLTTSQPFDAGTPLNLTLKAHGLPSYASATFSPASIQAGQPATLSLALTAAAPATTFTFGITAESGSSQAQTAITVGSANFSASLSPLTGLELTAGGASVPVTLSTQLLSGPARSFTVKVSGVPGVTATPASGQLGTPVTLQLSAEAGSPSSTSSASVAVLSSGVTHTTSLPLTVHGDDATISVPTNVTVAQGGTVSFPVTTATQSGNAQQLTLSATHLPTGATATFSPATVTSGQTSTATITVSATQAVAPVSITIVGTGPVALVSTALPLTVTAPPGGCASFGAAAEALPLALLALLVFARRSRRAQTA